MKKVRAARSEATGWSTSSEKHCIHAAGLSTHCRILCWFKYLAVVFFVRVMSRYTENNPTRAQPSQHSQDSWRACSTSGIRRHLLLGYQSRLCRSLRARLRKLSTRRCQSFGRTASCLQPKCSPLAVSDTRGTLFFAREPHPEPTRAHKSRSCRLRFCAFGTDFRSSATRSYSQRL